MCATCMPSKSQHPRAVAWYTCLIKCKQKTVHVQLHRSRQLPLVQFTALMKIPMNRHLI